jgi:predicted nucleotidyltransferase
MAQTASLDSAADLIRARFPDCLAIYAFGSRVGGYARADSDYDLAFLRAQHTDGMAAEELRRDLSLLLNAAVDLVDLHDANAVLRKEVVTNGRALHVGDDQKLLDFEARVLSDYGRYRDETAALREAIRESGRAYG